MDKKLFSHSARLRVRNYEVDWQGIVHNANYLLYFEVGRIEYLRRVGVNVDLNAIRTDSRVVLVRNEIDYRSPASFNEELEVYSRVVYIKKTSFAFEGLIEAVSSGRVVAENVAVHVWLDGKSGEPLIVPDDFRAKIVRFEKNNVAIFQPPSMA